MVDFNIIYSLDEIGITAENTNLPLIRITRSFNDADMVDLSVIVSNQVSNLSPRSNDVEDAASSIYSHSQPIQTGCHMGFQLSTSYAPMYLVTTTH